MLWSSRLKTPFGRLALLTAMKIELIASVAVITRDPPASYQLYVDALGLPLEGQDDYIHSEDIGGCKHFGVWPLPQAAKRASGPTNGEPTGQCRRRASNSKWRTPRPWEPQAKSHRPPATSC